MLSGPRLPASPKPPSAGSSEDFCSEGSNRRFPSRYSSAAVAFAESPLDPPPVYSHSTRSGLRLARLNINNHRMKVIFTSRGLLPLGVASVLRHLVLQPFPSEVALASAPLVRPPAQPSRPLQGYGSSRDASSFLGSKLNS